MKGQKNRDLLNLVRILNCISSKALFRCRSISIGAVENLQGISWQRIEIKGVANHAGTTPTNMRVDAGLAAAR